MTPADHNRDERDDPEADARFDVLFDIASRNDLESPYSADLTPAEHRQVQDMREVLDAVDAGWGQASAAELDDIETRFLALLAADEPDHPWVLQSARANHAQAASVPDSTEDDAEVATLGQLIEATAEDAPRSLPEEVLGRLLLNPTPITDLIDNQKRQTRIGAALALAEVPTREIPQTYQWLNQGIKSLTPLQGGAFLARRQQRKRRDDNR